MQATLECYIIEFFLENHQSFSKAKEMFKYGLWERLLNEISLWIKILMVEERLLLFQETIMEM